MTRRGARLVVAAAALSWTAAALAALAPRMPEGLAAACAPEFVARELLAGLAVAALLLAPAFVADDPERRPEDHTALLVVLPGLPAAAALLVAGGGAPTDLLPALALLLACDLASSSYLRLDPSGKRGVLFSAAAAALLAGIPVGAYGLAEFAGWQGAEAGFRISPLLAIRDVAGGWQAVAPAALLLVAAAAVLRLGGALLRPAAAAAVALLVLAVPAARAAEVGGRRSHSPVLVVGAPREGTYADLVAGIRARGVGVEEADALPAPLPWETEVVVFARAPRSADEEKSWMDFVSSATFAGFHVVAWSSKPSTTLFDPSAVFWDASIDAIYAASTERLDELLASSVAIPHPAKRPEPGVDPALHRIPFPSPVRSLPGSTLGFLSVLAAAFGGAAFLARRRGFGQGRSILALGGLSAAGAAMLFLPGVLGDSFLVERLVVEEWGPGWGGGHRADHRMPVSAGRRVELLRIERLRQGGADPVVGKEPGVSWAEIRYAADSAPTWQADGTVRLEPPIRYALLAGVSGVDTPPPAGMILATVEIYKGRALTRVEKAPFPGNPAGDGPGEEVGMALARLSRHEDPRVARAGALLAATFRPPRLDQSFRIVVPAEGPTAVVLHLPR